MHHLLCTRILLILQFYILSIFVCSASTGEWQFVGGKPTSFHGKARLTKGEGDTIFAGGDSGVAFWDGSGWNVIGKTPVARILYSNSKLYVSGHFTDIGGCKARNIAVWNGVEWSALGSGIALKNGQTIKTMAMGPDQLLHVGGELDSAGDLPTQYYAFWDGACWDTVGNGSIKAPVAFTFSNDSVMYVASMRTVMYRIHGDSEWVDISPNIGTVSGRPSEINALDVAPDGTLYAGGAIPILDGDHYYSGLIKWNGTSWECIGDIPMRVMDLKVSGSGKVFVFCTDDFFYYGTRQNFLTVDYEVFSVFDNRIDTVYEVGVGFSTVTGSVPKNPLSLVLTDDSTCQMICGRDVINHRNGNNAPLISGIFSKGHSFNQPTIFTSSSATESYMVGRDIVFNGRYLDKLAFWNGATWERIHLGDSYITGLRYWDDGSIVMSGAFKNIPGISDSLAVYDSLHKSQGIRLQNQTWSPIQTNHFPNVAENNRGDSFTFRSNTIFQWDGITWDTIGILEAYSSYFDSIPEVCALTCKENGDLIVVGHFDAVINRTKQTWCNNAAVWNGISWEPLGVPDTFINQYAQRGKKIRSIVNANNGDMYLATYAPKQYSTDILAYKSNAWERIYQSENNNDATEIALDSSGRLYINTYVRKNEGAPLCVYIDSVWYGVDPPVDIPSIFSISGMHVLPDGSTLRCIVQENGGYRYVLDYLPDAVTALSAPPQNRAESTHFIITMHSNFARITSVGLSNKKGLDVSIIDLHGRLVEKHTFNKGADVINIPIGKFADGVYQIVLRNGKTKHSRLLYKMR